MKRVGKKLGDSVALMKIDTAHHNIFLSSESVREVGFDKLITWLANTDFGK